jgi:hypothetical protein
VNGRPAHPPAWLPGLSYRLDKVVSGLAGTYVGRVSASAGVVERLGAFFGGTAQGLHHYAVVFDRGNPSVRRVLDTAASTLDGAPRSGRLDPLRDQRGGGPFAAAQGAGA